MTPEQKQVWDLVAGGMSLRQAADYLGIDLEAAKSRYRRAKKWNEADPAAQKAATVAGSNAIPHSFWLKTDSHSIYYKTPSTENDSTDFLERVAEAFKDIPAYVEPETQQDLARADLLTVYPVMDAHIGMFAWGKETGNQDYDLGHAEDDLRDAFGSIGLTTPTGGDALLILGGDTLHIDDSRSETPASKHKLDSDGRYHKVIDTAIRAVCWIVDHLVKRHGFVTVKVLRGNHDEHSHLILAFALGERYRNSISVHIDKSPQDIFMHRHGNSLIAAHHGDKSPPQRLAMMLADICPYWSETRDRHLLTGHIHHDSMKEFPGVKWTSLRAFCPPDAYGAMFAPRRALQAMVFDVKKGHIATAIEPIWRE